MDRDEQKPSGTAVAYSSPLLTYPLSLFWSYLEDSPKIWGEGDRKAIRLNLHDYMQSAPGSFPLQEGVAVHTTKNTECRHV